MKALFLAGGMGTRLREMTKQLPKPMIPIFSKPLLARNIARLKEFGVDEVVLSTCYMPDKIRDYFGDGSGLGIKIDYVHEETPLGTGGAIRNAAAKFDDTFLVFNGDIVSGIDLGRMLSFHKAHRAEVTIAATYVEDPSAYGVIEYDAQRMIRAFKEKPQPGETDSHLINAGIYLFEPSVLAHIPTGRPVSVERETYPALLAAGCRMAVYHEEAYWRDLGTPRDYLAFTSDLLDEELPVFGGLSKMFYGVCKGAVTSPEATIIAPSYIAPGAVVKAHAVVGPYAVVEEARSSVRARRSITLSSGRARGSRRRRRRAMPSSSLTRPSPRESTRTPSSRASRRMRRRQAEKERGEHYEG